MRQAEHRRQTRERDADVARETILRAALDIFAMRGFSGARVDDIAEAAGYNKALIFHYFSDKLGLYQTLVTRMKSDITARLGGNLAEFERDGDLARDAANCADFFTSCAHMVFDYYVSHPEIRRMMQWEVAEGWHTFSACPVKVADPQWPQRVTGVIRDAQAAGIVRSDLDPELPFMMCVSVPLIYLASIHRFELMFTERDYSSPEALKRARDQIAWLLLQGVLTPEAAAQY
ncbi:MAG: TetR/AcrR family transcriptional regulator, partial [Ktedonobacterales bacterium]